MATEFDDVPELDADEGYTAPTIPSMGIRIGGKRYVLSSPESSVWERALGLAEAEDEDEDSSTALGFLEETMTPEDFAEVKARAKDPDDVVDVFLLVHATNVAGREYGQLIAKHLASLDAPEPSRSQRRREARDAARAVGSGGGRRIVQTPTSAAAGKSVATRKAATPARRGR